jgi:hemerythrin superfamily protein
VLEGHEEHHLTQILILELSELKPDDDAWLPKVRLLREHVDHHVRREEGELFPKARIVLDEDKRRHLARRLQELRARWRKEAEVA